MINLVAGIFLIFVGIVGASLTDGSGDFVEGIASGFMMALIAIAVWLIVRASILLSRVYVANYNEAREQAMAESDM